MAITTKLATLLASLTTLGAKVKGSVDSGERLQAGIVGNEGDRLVNLSTLPLSHAGRPLTVSLLVALTNTEAAQFDNNAEKTSWINASGSSTILWTWNASLSVWDWSPLTVNTLYLATNTDILYFADKDNNLIPLTT